MGNVSNFNCIWTFCFLEITSKRTSIWSSASSSTDTSVMMEGEKAYIYTVSKDNIANKINIEIGIRQEGSIEILSGLNIGDIIVAEGLKKVYPRSKIKPIEKGSKNSGSDWKKKT